MRSSIINKRGAPALLEVAGRQIQSTHWGVNLNIVIIPKKKRLVFLWDATFQLGATWVFLLVMMALLKGHSPPRFERSLR
jgi:hypothetical protein